MIFLSLESVTGLVGDGGQCLGERVVRAGEPLDHFTNAVRGSQVRGQGDDTASNGPHFKNPAAHPTVPLPHRTHPLPGDERAGLVLPALGQPYSRIRPVADGEKQGVSGRWEVGHSAAQKRFRVTWCARERAVNQLSAHN